MLVSDVRAGTQFQHFL